MALTFRQLESLWIANGGDPRWAATMAGIALAESGANPSAVQQGQPFATEGWGLWQITPGGEQYLNPTTNAKTAVEKFDRAVSSGWHNGLGPWEGDPVAGAAIANGGRPLSLSQIKAALAPSGRSGAVTGGGGGLSSLPGYRALSKARQRLVREWIKEDQWQVLGKGKNPYPHLSVNSTPSSVNRVVHEWEAQSYPRNFQGSAGGVVPSGLFGGLGMSILHGTAEIVMRLGEVLIGLALSIAAFRIFVKAMSQDTSYGTELNRAYKAATRRSGTSSQKSRSGP